MSSTSTEYILHLHTDPSIQSVYDFVMDGGSIGLGMGIKELLAYEDSNNIPNIDNIKNRIIEENEEEYKELQNIIDNYLIVSEDELKKIPLKTGTTLALPNNRLDLNAGVIEGNQIIDTKDSETFIAEKLYSLIKDPAYVRGRSVVSSNLTIINDSVSIWVWSRSLSKVFDDQKDTYENKLIDITPFCTAVNLGNHANGGNFSISIVPVVAQYDNGWVIDRDFINNTVIHSRINFLSENDIRKRFPLFSSFAFKENDVVFIKLEKLQKENRRELSLRDLTIDPSELPGQIFDMIGLIDAPSTAANGITNFTITLQGKCLSKTVIDDEVHFYPLDFIDGGIFSNRVGATNEKLIRYGSQLLSRFQTSYRTIGSTMKFLINALSTISITPDTLFTPYKDKRSQAYQVTDDEKEIIKHQQQQEQLEVDRIKSLIRSSITGDNLTLTQFRVDYTYFSIVQFLNSMMSQNNNNGVQEELNGELNGWSSFLYNGETIQPNKMPVELSYVLFEGSSGWRNNNSQSQLEQSIQTLINDFESSLTKPVTQTISIELGRKELKVLDDNRDQTTLVQVTNINSMPFTETLSLSLSQNLITQEQYTNFLQRYNDLKSQVGEVNLTTLPSSFSDVNSDTSQAVKNTYSLLKKQKQSPSQQRSLQPVRGIWQIIKLIIDPTVANRRIVDRSIGNERASLMSGFRKICQPPFVELFTDTYGDQFYFTVRKPPFDRTSILSYIQGRVVRESIDEYTVQSYQTQPSTEGLSPLADSGFIVQPSFEPSLLVKTYQEAEQNLLEKTLLIDIDDADIVSENLSFPQQGYAWYHISPRNLIQGPNADQLAFAYIKAVFFEEYAEIYGSKALDISSNYIPFFPLKDKEERLNTANFIKQAILDLKYMIDTNAYLPFTKQGTITLSKTDRRIKRGMFIRKLSSNEVFYVEGVTHTASISNSVNSSTVLNVSRGMVHDFIEGVLINGQLYSYFNIINTEIPPNVFNNQELGYVDFNKAVTGNWKVNRQVFNFFIKNMQFTDPSNLKTLPDTRISVPPFIRSNNNQPIV